jgi:hypothetical protein
MRWSRRDTRSRLRFAYERLIRLAVASASEAVGRPGRSIRALAANSARTLGALSFRWWARCRHPLSLVLCCAGLTPDCIRRRAGKQSQCSVSGGGAGGAIFASAPEATPFQRVHPADFSTAATNESSAAQMDQPSPRDSITITINAAPAPRRGPIPCADRWGSSNIQSVQYRVSSLDYALCFEYLQSF